MDGSLLALRAGLDAVLRLQDGIVRRDQVMAAGVPESTLSSRVRRKAWIRVLPGVYAVNVDPSTPTSRVRATSLWAGDDSVITGEAAAWW
ncbi:MAG TPA: type IV toxin-antitoxin system AbiEi family antitoxin domain-containing protein [Nakamurella sp.]